MIIFEVDKEFDDLKRQKAGQCIACTHGNFIIVEADPTKKTIDFYGLKNRFTGTSKEVLKKLKKTNKEPVKRLVTVYARQKALNDFFKEITNGAIYGTDVFRIDADYLFDYKGLKLVGHELFDGDYEIREVISGTILCRSEEKSIAITKAKLLLEKAGDEYISKIRQMAGYYGMGTVQSSSIHVVKVNTLGKDKKKIKAFNKRTRGEKYSYEH